MDLKKLPLKDRTETALHLLSSLAKRVDKAYRDGAVFVETAGDILKGTTLPLEVVEKFRGQMVRDRLELASRHEQTWKDFWASEVKNICSHWGDDAVDAALTELKASRSQPPTLTS